MPEQRSYHRFCGLDVGMGATPVAVLLNLYLTRESRIKDAETVLQTVAMEAKRYGAVLIGGDTKERKEKSVGCVGVGLMPVRVNPIRRSGAKPGQIVAISLARQRADCYLEKGGTIRKIGVRWAHDVLTNRATMIGFGNQGELDRYLDQFVENNVKYSLLFLPAEEVIAGACTNKIAAAIDTSDGFMSCLEILARESMRRPGESRGISREASEEQLGFVLEESLLADVIDDDVLAISSGRD